MTRPLHILLVNNYTARGGIPKAVAFLGNQMAARGHKVSIISQRALPRWLFPLYNLACDLRDLSLPAGKRAPLRLGCEKLEQMYELDPAIQIIPYLFTDKNLKIQRLRQRIKALDPDVCVAMLPDGAHLVWAVTLMGTGIPYVYSEHASPRTIEDVFWSAKGRRAAMSGADAIHLLLPAYRDSVPDFCRERVTVIPNGIAWPKKSADAAHTGASRHTLLWLGRLQEEVKQCRLALDAFAQVARQFPAWRLLVAGDGVDGELVRAHAKNLSLGERIEFLGDVVDVWPLYADAQAFCFSSSSEGMPSALLEAMASGLPCAAFAGCEAAAAMLKDGKTGLLAEKMTAQALAQKLALLLGDAELRQRLGAAARAAVQEYGEARVADAWEALLQKTAQSKGATVMDKFREEPFASRARMSSRARAEWAIRDFGQAMPFSLAWRIKELPARLRWWLARTPGRA